ncbi:MAG: metallophosphoesterase, partial [Thermoproteota archaeon]|nr:metallophosphoesterase [Thermoproteota archaeon]
MRSPTFILIFLAVMVLLDFYVFQAIKMVSNTASPKTRMIIYTVYWTISILAIIGFLVFVLTDPDFLPKKFRTYLFATIIGLFLGKLISVIFFLIDDMRRLIQWITGKLLFRNTEAEQITEDEISRSAFLSWLGLAAGGTLFSSLIYGFTNKYNYDIRKVKLTFDNLPASFKGLKIVHISDIHSGSFTNTTAVMKGVKKIMDLQPDIILFSGDLVNDRATEMEDYMDVFSQLKAPIGVYSTFGNHDYGDYVNWPHNGITKQQNLVDLARVHAELGWRLLMNEHVVLEKNGE